MVGITIAMLAVYIVVMLGIRIYKSKKKKSVKQPSKKSHLQI